ncbi:MFS transporter [Catellatospora citrea]|uniref:MFS transporter n=1 Tax=Catellatospora citrea TaxID=53366 RepID=UPI0033E4F3AB
MATRTQTTVVDIAGVVQGIVLVTIPALSTILTDPAHYGLTSAQYGTMFAPQVVAAIAASLAGAGLARRHGTHAVYLAGLACSLASMVLLLTSAAVMHQQNLAYPLLLAATAFLGAGFGLAVPALNSLAAAFHPTAVDRAVLILNALLGLGTALAPVFVAVFVGLGFWWGLPVLSTLLLVALLAVSLRLPMHTGARAAASTAGGRMPARFWLYAAFALLYGICETVNGNWAQLDMTTSVGASTTTAALALTAFWAMVTLGRLLFAAITRWLPARATFHLLPFALAGVFGIIASLPHGHAVQGVIAFGAAGLCCSALLPLTISFGQGELTGFSAAVAGGVIAAYQLGYGIAAFGAGPLVNAGTPLSRLYAIAAFVALAMGLLSFAVAHRQRSPRTLHPAPAPVHAPAQPTT